MSDYSSRSSAELEREVEAQRHRLSDTIDEIQHKMSPGQLLDEVMDYTKGGGTEFAQNLGRSVKDNPLPVALVGAGLLWLMTGSSNTSHAPRQQPAKAEGYRPGDSDAWRSAAYDSGSGEGLVDKARHLGEDVTGRLGDAVDGITGSVGGLADEAGHATSDMLDTLQRQTRSLSHMYEDQPLIGGALAFALGAALGATLPHTSQEDNLLGEAADTIKEEATAKAGDAIAEGKDAVGKGYAEIKDKVGSVIEDSTNPNGHAGHYAT